MAHETIRILRPLTGVTVLVFIWTGFVATPAAARKTPSAIPPDSAMNKMADTQKVLLAACESASELRADGWRVSGLSVKHGDETSPRFGRSALQLHCVSQIEGGKADFTILNKIPGVPRRVGLWVYLPEDANVDRIGIQASDRDGEAFIFLRDADWTGWRWIEFDLDAQPLEHAYPQNQGNQAFEAPAGRLSVVWFTRHEGESTLWIDGICAATSLDAPDEYPFDLRVVGRQTLPRHGRLRVELLVTNWTDQSLVLDMAYHLQRDPTFYDRAAPHPIHGDDHALGARSRTVAYGNTVAENTLTDGLGWTAAEANARKDQRLEAFQYVELPRSHRISHLAFNSGDANWTWNVEVMASTDGEQYEPVKGLESVDLHKQWGRRDIAVSEPFEARHLKLRYWKPGKPAPRMRFPSSLMIYDGLADETFEPPQPGETLAKGLQSVNVPPRSFTTVTIENEQPLETGRYLLTLMTTHSGQTRVAYEPIYAQLPEVASVDAKSRFGMNTSNIALAPMMRELGVGWVRFENLKWPFVAPEPGRFRFDGSVGPWFVDHDAIFERYHDLGITTLPYLYQTPQFESTAPTDLKKRGRRLVYPPKNNEDYGAFVFQVVARYGHQKHPDDVLLTDDKKSGLGYMDTFELWNEPNLNNPGWGHWVGTLPEYFEMYRRGAEAVKRADPSARVANGGWAGISLDFIDRMRTYTYADGSTPLDYTDVLSVHYYTGRSAPELNTINTNIDRSGKHDGGDRFEDLLQRLVDWRDRYKPNMPIWFTETGYDSNGGWGVGERLKATWVPRISMICLAHGVDKVMLFRERGSGNTRFSSSGVLRNDNSHDPSWFTYGTMLRQLRDVEVPADRLDVGNDNVRVYAWRSGDKIILTAWAIEDDDTLPLNLGSCTVTDAFGYTQSLTIDGELKLTELPTYIRDIGDVSMIEPLIAQARQRERQRSKEADRLAGLRVVLFDFGSKEDVGSIVVGTHRPATPITKEDVWDAEKGFGFSPGPAVRDDNGKWQRAPLDQDATRIGRGTAFRFRLDPGRYRLRIFTAPMAAETELTVSGVRRPQSLTATRSEPEIALDIQVDREPVSIETDRHVGLRWIAAIEADPVLNLSPEPLDSIP